MRVWTGRLAGSLIACAVALLASGAGADVVRLRGGVEVEGRIVKVEKHQILLETLTGLQAIPRSRVEKWDRRPWDVDTFRRRLAQLRTGRRAAEAESLFAWATAPERVEKLQSLLPELCGLILEIDPEHAGSRARLGFERIDGAWLPREEAEQVRAEKERVRAAAEAEELERAARAREELWRKAAAWGGMLLEKQIADEAADDARDAELLARSLGVPAVTVRSSYRISIQGFLGPEEARALLDLGERALSRWGEELFGQVALNPFSDRRVKFHYYSVDQASIPAMVEHVARLHGGVSPKDRRFYAAWGLGIPPNGYKHLCVRPLELDPRGLEESFLLALARAWAEAASGSRLMPWLPEGFAREALRRFLGVSPCLRAEFLLEGRPLGFSDGVEWLWLARTLGRLRADPPLQAVIVKEPEELTCFDLAKATGVAALLWERDPRLLGRLLRLLGFKHGTQRWALKELFQMDPEGVDKHFRAWAQSGERG